MAGTWDDPNIIKHGNGTLECLWCDTVKKENVPARALTRVSFIQVYDVINVMPCNGEIDPESFSGYQKLAVHKNNKCKNKKKTKDTKRQAISEITNEKIAIPFAAFLNVFGVTDVLLP